MVKTVMEEFSRNTAIFEIKGLREVGADTFELTGVKELAVNWRAIVEQLMEAGIEEGDAAVYGEEFAELVLTREMAKALAKRMKRVG